MKKLLLIFTLVITPQAQAAGDPEAGKIKSASCAACHGIDGNSAQAQYPKLAAQHPKYLVNQLNGFKLGAQTQGAKGRYNPLMAGFALSLSTQEMSDLAAFYAAQPVQMGSTPESAIAAGEALYLAGNTTKQLPACVACHGPRGNGTPSSGFAKISNQHPDYLKAQLVAFSQGARANDANQMMRTVAAKLSESEMTILAAYLHGLH